MTEIKRNTVNPFKILSISIGIIYFWFGVLKFFFGLSPAEKVAEQTIHELTFGLMPDHIAITILAIWECGLGVMLIIRKSMKFTLLLMFTHMVFTFTPFIFFPDQTFMHMPYGFTLLGQYIMKNIIIISSGAVLWQFYVKRTPGVYMRPFSESGNL